MIRGTILQALMLIGFSTVAYASKASEADLIIEKWGARAADWTQNSPQTPNLTAGEQVGIDERKSTQLSNSAGKFNFNSTAHYLPDGSALYIDTSGLYPFLYPKVSIEDQPEKKKDEATDQ